MTSTHVLHTSFSVRDVRGVLHISGVTSDRVWVSDFYNLILTDTTGDTKGRVTDGIPMSGGGLHTVNTSGELIYIDSGDNINKLSIDSKTATILLEIASPWLPVSVYCSLSTGDLIVGMRNRDTETGKMTRYNSTGQPVLTIQHDNTGSDLYRYPNYITENENGDIIVSDWFRGAVVVTERGGRYRFSYTGPPPGSSLEPRGICTDALSHMLVCDGNTHTVQMIDKDGNFLSLLLTPQHEINKPHSLNYDDENHLLWVGSEDTNTVFVYRQRRYSLTDDPIGDDEISKTKDDKKIWKDTSKNPKSTRDFSLSARQKRGRIHFPGRTNPNPDDRLSKVSSSSGVFSDDMSSVDSGMSSMHSVISSSDTGVNVDVKEREEKYKPENAFNKMPNHLGETGEAGILTQSLVYSLDIDVNPHLRGRSQMIYMDYRKIMSHLDYLDCVGRDFGMTRMAFIRSIEPLFGHRLNDFDGWMKVCKHVLGKTRSTQWGSTSVLFAIFAKEAILKFKPKELTSIMRCAMENENHILAFEIVKTYLFDHVIELQRLFQDAKGITSAIMKTILRTSRKMILRKFPNLQKNAFVLSFCWECGQGNRLVMIMSYRGNIDISDKIPNEIMGLKLVLYNFTQPSDEASSVFKPVNVPFSKKTALPTVTEDEARELFRKHSNLTMVSASPYKSIGYSKGKHRVIENTCISLFCFHKGYIPYREERFPKQLREFEVDVQEGYCVLGSGASLEIGGCICRAGCGSIGGFVDLPNNKTGLITCAHVIFSSNELGELESMNGVPPGIEVKAFNKTAHTYRVCGTCTAAEFPKCFQQATSPHPNVDAALIELDPVIDTFRLRTVSSDQLYSAGFDPDSPPTFSGESVPPEYRICGRIQDKLESVVKYGIQTGLTIGHLYHSGVHVRFINHNLKLPDSSRSAIMCDQIEIQNFPQGQFFECGDSGSFVFCINPDKTLSCLGMAVGVSLPQRSCLVTPIDRILDNLCPGACLRPCGSPKTVPNIDKQQEPSSAVLQLILNELTKMRTDNQTLQRNTETRLQNFQTSLQNIEKNVESVQASVLNLHSHEVQQTEDIKTQSPYNQSSANQN